MKIKNTQTLIGIVSAVLLALLFSYFYYISRQDRDNVPPLDPRLDTTAENDTNAGNDAHLPDASLGRNSMDVSEEPIGSVSSIPVPGIDRPVVFNAGMPEEAREIYRKNIAALSKSIKETGGLVSEWLNLGILWKQVGDYDGARLAWEYVAAIRPDANNAFLNLGDLYHYYLKDFAKAESNFKKGITNDPKYVPGYVGLHELYKYSYKQNTAAAVSILLDGLRETDDSINLLVPLALYYAEKGDVENARVYYKKALTKAKEAGDTARAALLQEELDRL